MTDMLNTGITVPPLPRNERATAYGLDILPASFGEGFGAQFDDQMTRNPAPSIARMFDRAQFFPGTDEFGNETPARTPSKMLTAQEANDQYGIAGRLKFDADTPEPIAQELKKLKVQEIERQETMRRAQAGLGTALTAGLAASILDPLNIASAFIPVVGEARYAALVARLGVTGARAVRGAAEGFVGAAVLEPFVLAGARYEQADYDAADSLANLAFGTALGAGLHMGGGAITDRIAARKSASALERSIDDLSPSDREALLRTSVAQVAESRPVDVTPVVQAIDAADLARARRSAKVMPTDDDAKEFLRRIDLSELTPDETRALEMYADKQRTSSDSDFFTAEDGKNRVLFESIAAKVTAPEDIVVYRGTSVSETGLDRGVFTPTTLSREWATTMGAAKYADQQLMEIVVPKGTPIIPIARGDLGEMEIVLPVKTAAQKVGARMGTTSLGEDALETRWAVRLSEAAQTTGPKLPPDEATLLSDIERRFSEVQARPDAIADELKTVEAEVKELDRLLPADSEAKATTPAMQEANVYAKAWEAAVACRVGKA